MYSNPAFSRGRRNNPKRSVIVTVLSIQRGCGEEDFPDACLDLFRGPIGMEPAQGRRFEFPGAPVKGGGRLQFPGGGQRGWWVLGNRFQVFDFWESMRAPRPRLPNTQPSCRPWSVAFLLATAREKCGPYSGFGDCFGRGCIASRDWMPSKNRNLGKKK